MVGILTDTMNFARGAMPQDFEAFRYLRGLADLDLLGRLQSPPMSPDALDLLARAIKGSKLKGGYLITNVGEVKNRDLIAQTADFLLKREGVMTVLVYGICGSAVYASARTNDVALHLGQTLKEAFSLIGSAGGHARMAGATIPLRVFGRGSKRAVQTEINRKVGRRFLEVVGAVKPKAKRKRSKR
jgi:nanoRNase/pAp phosphatase (c-di-AMP/oligoRNAs hydrolase)